MMMPTVIVVVVVEDVAEVIVVIQEVEVVVADVLEPAVGVGREVAVDLALVVVLGQGHGDTPGQDHVAGAEEDHVPEVEGDHAVEVEEDLVLEVGADLVVVIENKDLIVETENLVAKVVINRGVEVKIDLIPVNTESVVSLGARTSLGLVQDHVVKIRNAVFRGVLKNPDHDLRLTNEVNHVVKSGQVQQSK